MLRNEAETKLKEIFGLRHFYNEQWKTIEKLLNGERILLIEKTGYGKSLCYQFPATQFEGVTVIFSPLIALMRDQVNNLNSLGIPAKYINSEQTPEENNLAIQEAIDGKLKILYIAPERQENQEWIEATRNMDISMIVIDEAHTISVWGHDFRPAFRRIVNLVNLLPKELPVLATTATATKRVQSDIEKQISGNLTTIRGHLLRDNFHLFVIETKSEDEKLLWLAENLDNIPGTGLIYTGTRVNTQIYSRWLEYFGIESTDYNAGFDAETRKSIEKGLIDNKWKCVVSTNALGMGIDKPDIGFIIHTQIPESPIHYYQEIGRAGRDGEKTYIILFYNSEKDEDGIPEDYKLPKAFIDGGRPSIKKYQQVIDCLRQEQLTENQLMKKTNLKQTQVRVIKADLIEQEIVREVIYGRSKKYEYQFDAPELDDTIFDELRQFKLKELDSMIDYVYTKKPRMKFLCDYLGDVTNTTFNNCDNTKFKKRVVKPKQETINKLNEFRETYFPVLNVESNYTRLENGVAASYYGFSNIGSTIHRCKYENGGDFPDYLLKMTLKAFRKEFGKREFDLLVYVPSTLSGNLVKNFAEKISSTLNIPISHNLVKTHKTEPQKVFQNWVLKRDNVSGAFDYTTPGDIMNKKILLFDDIFDSGATIKEIGKLLTNLGANSIFPIVIAKTVGGDLKTSNISLYPNSQHKVKINKYKLKKILLNDYHDNLKNIKEAFKCELKQLMCITTETGKQIIFRLSDEKILKINCDNNEKLIPETFCKSDPLWLFDYVIKKCRNYQEYLESSIKGFLSYNDQKIIDKKYFITRNFIFKYLPKRNLLIVLGMADNSVGKGPITHWANRSCLSIWNMENCKLEFEFFPSYPFGDFEKIDVSEDERYFTFIQSYEWSDLYLFDLEKKQFIFSSEFYSKNKNVQPAIRNAFFYKNYLILPASNYYEGEDFGIGCINLITQQYVELINKKSFSFSFLHETLKYNNNHMFIFDIDENRNRCFDLKKILKKELIEIDLGVLKNLNHPLFFVDDYDLFYIKK
jgi:ATP-dependent DNA helicase RecQ